MNFENSSRQIISPLPESPSPIDLEKELMEARLRAETDRRKWEQQKEEWESELHNVREVDNFPSWDTLERKIQRQIETTKLKQRKLKENVDSNRKKSPPLVDREKTPSAQVTDFASKISFLTKENEELFKLLAETKEKFLLRTEELKVIKDEKREMKSEIQSFDETFDQQRNAVDAWRREILELVKVTSASQKQLKRELSEAREEAKNAQDEIASLSISYHELHESATQSKALHQKELEEKEASLNEFHTLAVQESQKYKTEMVEKENKWEEMLKKFNQNESELHQKLESAENAILKYECSKEESEENICKLRSAIEAAENKWHDAERVGIQRLDVLAKTSRDEIEQREEKRLIQEKIYRSELDQIISKAKITEDKLNYAESELVELETLEKNSKAEIEILQASSKACIESFEERLEQEKSNGREILQSQLTELRENLTTEQASYQDLLEEELREEFSVQLQSVEGVKEKELKAKDEEWSRKISKVKKRMEEIAAEQLITELKSAKMKAIAERDRAAREHEKIVLHQKSKITRTREEISELKQCIVSRDRVRERMKKKYQAEKEEFAKLQISVTSSRCEIEDLSQSLALMEKEMKENKENFEQTIEENATLHRAAMEEQLVESQCKLEKQFESWMQDAQEVERAARSAVFEAEKEARQHVVEESKCAVEKARQVWEEEFEKKKMEWLNEMNELKVATQEKVDTVQREMRENRNIMMAAEKARKVSEEMREKERKEADEKAISAGETIRRSAKELGELWERQNEMKDSIQLLTVTKEDAMERLELSQLELLQATKKVKATQEELKDAKKVIEEARASGRREAASATAVAIAAQQRASTLVESHALATAKARVRAEEAERGKKEAEEKIRHERMKLIKFKKTLKVLRKQLATTIGGKSYDDENVSDFSGGEE